MVGALVAILGGDAHAAACCVSATDIVAAHAEGTVLRLRPKIMTITAMGAGLLPLLWADGAGSEIMGGWRLPCSADWRPAPF